jgi:putative spermidine/putrescine transport system permease protein
MREALWQRIGSASYRAMVVGGGGLGVLFLVAPIGVALVMSLTAGQTLKFPPQGYSLRWYAALVDPTQSGTEQIAAFNSLKIAVLAVLGSLAIAVPASIGMTRLRRRAAILIEPLLLAPLVLPSLVYGLAALVIANGLGIRPSLWLTVVGHVVVFAPLMYRAALVVSQALDPALEEASITLGGGVLTTLARITLPLMLPGIAAGAFLVFLESLDNVSVTLFLADPQTTVLPLRMFALIEESLDPRVAAMSGVLIVVTLAGLFVARQVFMPSRGDAARRGAEGG